MTPTIAVAEVLQRARDMTEPQLAEAFDRLPASIRRAASYHVGWTEADGRPRGGTARGRRGGKFVRPALAILSAEATWAGPEVGVPGAVAVELVHNFSLLHDDLMDGDLERHHRPTVWALWGPSLALLAGDALSTLATEVLLGSKNPAAPAAASALCQATAEMIAGQADDLAFEHERSVSVEECMAMSTAKTGALLGCAASIGAILADAPPATVRALEGFGRHLGVAFQAVDDLLGIWGDPATTGKPAGNDIRQRKKSMPIVAALAAGDEESRELDALLFGDPRDSRDPQAVPPRAVTADETVGGGPQSNGHAGNGAVAKVAPAPAQGQLSQSLPAQSQLVRSQVAPAPVAQPDWVPAQARPLSAEEVARATSLVERCGGREWTAARAKAHLDAALGSLERARLSALPRRALADLAVYVVERES